MSPTPAATGAATSTVTPDNGNCNSDTKTLALTVTTSFLGLVIAAASAWTGWKQYRQKRLKAKQPDSRNETPSPEGSTTDAELPPMYHDNAAPITPTIPQEVREDP